MEVVICKNKEEASKLAAAMITAQVKKNPKTVLVLDGQAEANVAARFFVSREDEVRVRRRGEARRVKRRLGGGLGEA